MHIGIIPDGNRRWCTKTGQTIFQIAQILHNVLTKHDIDSFFYGLENMHVVKEVSMYILSVDNLEKRKDNTLELIEAVFDIIINFENSSILNYTKFQAIGELDLLPDNLKNKLDKITKRNVPLPRLIFNLAVAYDPIKDCRRIVNNAPRTEQSSIDLVIRFGKEKRMSGFFPLQTLYSEWIFMDKLWPDFQLKDIDDAIADYYKRERRFGA